MADRYADAETRNLHAMIPAQDKASLEEICAETGAPLSHHVRLAIHAYLAERSREQ